MEEESSEEESSDGEEEVRHLQNFSVYSEHFLYFQIAFKWFLCFLLQAAPPKVVKKATPAKAAPVKNGAAAKKAESEDDDDDSGKWKYLLLVYWKRAIKYLATSCNDGSGSVAFKLEIAFMSWFMIEVLFRH